VQLRKSHKASQLEPNEKRNFSVVAVGVQGLAKF